MDDFVQHKPLSKTIMFWVVLVIPVFLALVVGCLIYLNSQLGSFCLASSCVNNFFDLYKVPLAMAGSALPLVAVVAAVQRSKEAFLQIQVGQRQYTEAVSNNRFGNYLKHRDGFYKLVDNFCEDKGSESSGKIKIDANVLYVRFFPNSTGDDLDWWKGEGVEYWKTIETEFVTLSKCLKKSFDDYETLDVGEFTRLTRAVTKSLMFNYEPCRFVMAKNGALDECFLAKNLVDESLAIFSTIREVIHFYNSIVAYAGREAVGELFEAIYSEKVIPVIQANIEKFEVGERGFKIT